MSAQAPRGPQRLVPYLMYRNAAVAIEHLCRAFGFEETFRYPMPDGRIGHAELLYQGNTLMLADSYPDFGTSPLDLPTVHCSIFCFVDDVDAHHARAFAAGATILGEPSDQHGMRLYRALDSEGHHWAFAGPLAAASPS